MVCVEAKRQSFGQGEHQRVGVRLAVAASVTRSGRHAPRRVVVRGTQLAAGIGRFSQEKGCQQNQERRRGPDARTARGLSEIGVCCAGSGH